MKQNSIAVILLVAVITGAGGFFAGTKYQQSQRITAFPMMNGQGGRGAFFGNGTGNGSGNRTGTRNGMRPVSGEIIKSDDSSITVKLQDGSSKIILLTGSTQINKASAGTKTDLSTGTVVAVFGAENPDGSVTAQNVQINPMMRGFGGTPTLTK